MSKTIALMTDFGLNDIYVGVMKGVMAKIAPESSMIDITHAINPQHVRQGAFSLLNAYRYFPEDTVFLVVIDPGVGSTRRPIAVKAGGYWFVAPDNGVLSYALKHFEDVEAVELANEAYHLQDVSRTFHGRDIFAPAAAHLAAGVPLDALGPRLDDIIRLPQPEFTASGRQVTGEVVHIDHFGNITTSIGYMQWLDEERLTLTPIFGEKQADVPVLAGEARIKVGGEEIYGIRISYSEALRGDVLALVGSAKYLEIAVNQGSAAQRLDVHIGDRVELEIGDVNAAIRD